MYGGGQYIPSDYTNLPYIQQIKSNSIQEMNSTNASDDTASESTTSSKSKLKRKMLLNKPLNRDSPDRLVLRPQIDEMDVITHTSSADNQNPTKYQYV